MRELPCWPLAIDRDGAARALGHLLWRQHDRGRGRLVLGAQLPVALQPHRQDDGDRAAGQAAAAQHQPGIGEAQPMAADRHRPVVGIADLAIARVVGLELAQQEAALLQPAQPRAGVALDHRRRQQPGDVEARLAGVARQLLRVADLGQPVAGGIGGAVARPVAPAVHIGVEGGAGGGVGGPGLAQGPGADVPGRRILGPGLAPHAFARGVVLRDDLVVGVGQHQLGLGQDAALAQRVGDGGGGVGKAQQYRAVHGIDRRAAGEGRVPFAAVDGGGFALCHLEHVVDRLREGTRGRGGKGRGAGEKQAASIDGKRHAAC